MAQGWMDLPWRWFKLHAADAPKPVANDFLKSCQDTIEKLEDLMKSGRSSQEYLMNEKQFRFIVKKL
jgi:hypothetical protein